MIKVPYARLALCSEHFLEYFERRVMNTVKKYGITVKGGKYVVGVSGGKDSAALLASLKALQERGELEVDLLPVHVDVGIPGFSEIARESAIELGEALGLKTLVIEAHEVMGVGVNDIAKRVGRPICSVCGLVKRYFLNLIASEVRADSVLLGHHLDDLFAYALKSMLLGDESSLGKLGPKTPSSGIAVGRGRPLYLITGREALAYTILRKLPFLRKACPYARKKSLESRIKEFGLSLDQEYPGLRISFMKRLARSVEGGERFEEARPINKCSYCGMPTSKEICSFCSVTAKALGAPKGPEAVKYVENLLKSEGLK